MNTFIWIAFYIFFPRYIHSNDKTEQCVMIHCPGFEKEKQQQQNREIELAVKAGVLAAGKTSKPIIF